MKIESSGCFLMLAFVALVGCAAPEVVESTSERSVTLAALIHDADDLTTFGALLGHEGLAKYLESRGPYTVFAPTNDAFAALPDGAIETLLHPENRADLTEFVGSFVAPGVWHLGSGQRHSGVMVSGNRAWIAGADEYGTFAGAPIIGTPVAAGNGLLYRTSVAPLPEGWARAKDRILRPGRRPADSRQSYP